MTDVTLIKFEMVVDGQRQEAGFVSRDKLDGLLEDPGTLGAFLRCLRDAETAEDVLLQCDPTGHRYFYFWCPNCETRVVVETAERGIDDSRDVDALPETDIPCPMCSHMMWTWDEVALRDESFMNRGTWADFRRWRSKLQESPWRELVKPVPEPEAALNPMLAGLTEDQLKQAFKNVGVDVTCGACMSQFFTGGTQHAHTCREDGGSVFNG